MGVPKVLATEMVVHIDRKVTAHITKKEAIDVIGRLTVSDPNFADTADQWTPYDVDVLERALKKVKEALNHEPNAQTADQRHL